MGDCYLFFSELEAEPFLLLCRELCGIHVPKN